MKLIHNQTIRESDLQNYIVDNSVVLVGCIVTWGEFARTLKDVLFVDCVLKMTNEQHDIISECTFINTLVQTDCTITLRHCRGDLEVIAINAMIRQCSFTVLVMKSNGVQPAIMSSNIDRLDLMYGPEKDALHQHTAEIFNSTIGVLRYQIGTHINGLTNNIGQEIVLEDNS